MIKKLSAIFTALLLVAGFALMPVAASAVTTSCEITGTTGPGSNNECEATGEENVECTTDNNIDVDNDNNQDAESGDSNSSDNSTGGSANSGNAGNENETDVDVNIDNNCEGAGGNGSTTPEAPATPSTPEVLGESSAKVATPTTLPATGPEQSIVGIGASLATLAYISASRLQRPSYEQ